MINPLYSFVQVYVNARTITEESLQIITCLAANCERPDYEAELSRAANKLSMGARLRTELRTSLGRAEPKLREQFYLHTGRPEHV